MIFIRVCLADKWTPKSVSCNKFVARQKEVNVDVLVNCSSFFAGCLCVQEWTLAALSLANTRTIMHTSGHRNWSDVECTIIPLLWSRLDLFSSFGASDWHIFVDAVEAHSCLGSKCPAVDVVSVVVDFTFIFLWWWLVKCMRLQLLHHFRCHAVPDVGVWCSALTHSPWLLCHCSSSPCFCTLHAIPTCH